MSDVRVWVRWELPAGPGTGSTVAVLEARLPRASRGRVEGSLVLAAAHREATLSDKARSLRRSGALHLKRGDIAGVLAELDGNEVDRLA